jgi:hypothetical protein
MRDVSPYQASRIRHRASPQQMVERAAFLLHYANQHGPVTVRQLYYAAEVARLPGITKDDRDYGKIQYLELRRDGLMPYEHIPDATRWMRKPKSYDSAQHAVAETARLYRQNIWTEIDERCDVWLEKDALAGVILPVTAEYDVPLMVTRGFSSETFTFEAAHNYRRIGLPVHVYHLHDFDRSGVDASRDLERKLKRFAAEAGIEVSFTPLEVTADLVEDWDLPTREPKRKTPADRRWPHDFACELDAIPPDDLRSLVRWGIKQHLPDDKLKVVPLPKRANAPGSSSGQGRPHDRRPCPQAPHI